MASGLPIITTRRGGNAEVIDGTSAGVVIDDYRSAETFAGTIGGLLSDPEGMRTMARRARRVAEERFGWERVAADLWAVCREAAALPSGRRPRRSERE